MKKILITGGAGFIGLKLSTQLLCKHDCQITIIDNLLPQVHGPHAKRPLELNNPRVCFFQSDISDFESLARIVEDADPDVVIHLASETGTGQSYDEIIRYSQVNVLGTAILMQILRNKAHHLQKVILASSRAVYGEGSWFNTNSERVFPRTRSLTDLQLGQFYPRIESEILTRPSSSQETDPVSPASIYASTKLMQEYLVLRPFNFCRFWSCSFVI
jgi:dTDP-L-rhamnose 4-epimerase